MIPIEHYTRNLFTQSTHNADSIMESKAIYYLEQCGLGVKIRLGVLFFLSLSSINIVPHQQNTINNM